MIKDLVSGKWQIQTELLKLNKKSIPNEKIALSVQWKAEVAGLCILLLFLILKEELLFSNSPLHVTSGFFIHAFELLKEVPFYSNLLSVFYMKKIWWILSKIFLLLLTVLSYMYYISLWNIFHLVMKYKPFF